MQMKPDEVAAAVAEPPEQLTPLSAPIVWVNFDRYPNSVAAHIVAGLLENEGVPALVINRDVIPGVVDHVCLLVPKHLVHRARWILALQPPSDTELTFLATGKLPHES